MMTVKKNNYAIGLGEKKISNMEKAKMDETKEFAKLIGKGFNGTPFSAEDNVEFTWDFDKNTHETILSFIKMLLRGNVVNSLLSEDGKDKIEVVYNQVKSLQEIDGRYNGKVNCECSGVFCLISIFLGFYNGSIMDNDNQDILPDKSSLIEFCTNLFNKIKRV